MTINCPGQVPVARYARDLTDIYKSVIDEYMPLKKKKLVNKEDLEKKTLAKPRTKSKH